VEKYAHSTARLNQHQTWLGLALGGELGSRLADRLRYPVSASTLIKRVRNLTPAAEKTTSEIKVLGVIERVVPPTPSEYVRSQRDQIKRQQWHAARKERYEKVQELKYEQGRLSVSPLKSGLTVGTIEGSI